MKVLRFLLMVGIFTIGATQLKAQLPNLAMFYENISWQNPAVLAGEEGREVGLYDHLQSAGPRARMNTLLLYGEKRGQNQGYGANYYGEYFGTSQQHALQSGYAHSIVSGELGVLTLGASIGAYLYRSTSGLLNENRQYLVANIGVAYRNGNFIAAYNTGRKAFVDAAVTQGFFSQYKFEISESLHLLPTANVTVFDSNAEGQFGLVASVYGLADVGLMYSTISNGTDLNFGLNLFKNYRIGYSVVGLGSRAFTTFSQEFFLAWQPDRRGS